MRAPTETDELEVYSIAMPDTRPTMLPVPYVGEMPIELGAFIFACAGICFVVFGWQYSLWAPFAWLVAGRVVAQDYHAITKVQRWLQTTAWATDASIAWYGGSATTPNPKRPSWLRGMANQENIGK